MQEHGNLTPAEQQRELQNEPGFRELPPQTQQQYLNELNRLNSMPAPARDRRLEQIEILEHMNPQQLQQYHAAERGILSQPPARRRLMVRAILDLREMPPVQRQQEIDSPRFAAQFSDSERAMIRTALTAEPYHPAQ